MADFLFSSRRRDPGDLEADLRRQLGHLPGTFAEMHGDWGSLAVSFGGHEPSPIVAAAGGWAVVVTTPGYALGKSDASGWTAGDPVPDGSRPPGPFAALTVDERTRRGAVSTDVAAFIPIYAARDTAGESLVIGTHPDAVARAAGRQGHADLVSVADLLLFLTCTPPHTPFEGVEQLPPASHRRFGLGGWVAAPEAYWQPVEELIFASVDEAAASLREALVGDVRRTCDGLRSAGILISGGEDARTVLAAVPPGTHVTAFTFGDWESREIRVSRRTAAAHGADFVFGRREPDHYAAGFEAVARTVGSAQLFSDVHGYGFHDTLGLRNLPVVLGGLSSDAFLKAYHDPGLTDPHDVKLPPHEALDREIVAAVVDRRIAYRRRLAEIRPESWSEWERLWPFSMRKHAANFHGNRRLFASHEPFQAEAIVRVAASVPQAWKRRRQLFHRAFKPLLARSWYVPHARYRFPYFGNVANLPLAAGLGVARGLRAVATGQTRARHGPWPKWRYLVGSEGIRRRFELYPIEESPIAPVFRPEYAGRIGDEVRERWYALRALMSLQLSYLGTIRDD